MYMFVIVSSLFILKSYVRNQDISGFDERVLFLPNIIKVDNVTKEQIMKIHEKSEMLNFLESNDMHKEDKLYELSGRGVPSVFNILKGGLLSDWNFKFDDEFHTNALIFDGL